MTAVAIRVRDAAHTAAHIGAFIAVITFARVALAFVMGNVSPLYLVESPVLGFAIYFAAAFILQITGAVHRDGAQLIVNPWFAWMVIGGIVSFIVTLLIRGHALEHPHILQVATAAAGAWISAVVLVWGGVKLLGNKSPGRVDRAPSHLGGGHIVNSSAESDHSRVLIGGGTLFIAGIVIGAAFGSRGNWSSSDTSLIVVGGIALWRGITMLRTSPDR